MDRMARIRVEIDKDRIAKDYTPEEYESVIDDIKREVERYVEKYYGKPYASVEFTEWEEFCPKCEAIEVERVYRPDEPYGHQWVWVCQVTACGHEWKGE